MCLAKFQVACTILYKGQYNDCLKLCINISQKRLQEVLNNLEQAEKLAKDGGLLSIAPQSLKHAKDQKLESQVK